MKQKLKLFSVILVSLLTVLILFGSIYETISYRNIKDNYPPDGLMVNVGDRNIHVSIKGKKTDLPPVVVETGTGTWSYDWAHVQEELSQHTQVLTYDRAGYGWSDPPINGFSLEDTISDLDLIIKETNIEVPFILIGHSVGGVYARHFTDKYTEKVAGLILIDSRNEFFKDGAPTYNKKFFRSQDQGFNKILSRVGIIRLAGANTLVGMPDFISKEKYAHVQYDVPFFKVLNQEIRQISENVELLKNLHSLNDKPLTVITPKAVDTKAEDLGFSKQQADEINQKWVDAQEQLMELSLKSKLIKVPNSSHAVMYDQPKIIVDTVLDMGKEIRDELE